MTLQEFLEKQYPNMSPCQAATAFAKEIGTSRQNIERYRAYRRWPSPVMIASIRKASKGLVTADDHLPPRFKAKPARRSRAA